MTQRPRTATSRCWQCGADLPPGTPVCTDCGTSQADRPDAPPPPSVERPAPSRKRGTKLRKLFTRHWKGTCPDCGKVRTSANTRCPIEHSPLVVSFDAPRWNPLTFPLGSAELRCIGNCGVFATTILHCEEGCTGIIAGRNLTFRFSYPRTILYHIFHICILIAIGSVAVPAGLLLFYSLFYLPVGASDTFLGLFLLGALLSVWTYLLPKYRWPFRFRFTFEDVAGKWR